MFEKGIGEFPSPIFLIGCMRSGTSYLSNVIGEHHDIVLLSDYSGPIQEIFSAVGGMPSDDLDQGCPYLTEKDVSCKQTLDLGAALSACLIRERTWKGFLARLKFRMITKSGGVRKNWDNNTRLLIKSTHLMNKIRYIDHIFDDALYILLVRDVYGHSYSIMRHFEAMLEQRGLRYYLNRTDTSCWIPKKTTPMDENLVHALEDFSCIPEMYFRLNDLSLRDLRDVAPGRFLVLTFNEVVNNLNQELSRVWDFVGVSHPNPHSVKNNKRKLFNAHTDDPENAWELGLSEQNKSTILAYESEYQLTLPDVMPLAV